MVAGMTPAAARNLAAIYRATAEHAAATLDDARFARFLAAWSTASAVGRINAKGGAA